MTFFEKIFGLGNDKKTPQPSITFGRYTDIYKTTEQYDAWDKSMQHFEKEEFMDAYRLFFKYLGDEKTGSLAVTEIDEKINFEIQQGSRMVTGFVDKEKVKAQGLIARAEVTNVGFMRRLMEFNFSLKYCRFALTPENYIAVIFDTYTADGSPLKLYHALKELAINADKQDDLLLDEFKMLEPAPRSVVEEISDTEKEVKYNLISTEIKRAFDAFDAGKPDPNLYPGGYAYLFLWLTYKLDYLVRPEGFMMETLEKIHRDYFGASEEKTIQLKTIAVRKELQKLFDRPKEEHFKEMYRTRSTFGITTPVNHDKLAGLIDSELPNMDWYKDNNHLLLATAIPGYIAGYALFNFALPKPDREMLHLFNQLMEPTFFNNLGYDLPYFDKNGVADRKTILSEIKNIVERNKEVYPKFKPDTSKLDFSSQVLFAQSFLWVLKDCDLTKKEG